MNSVFKMIDSVLKWRTLEQSDMKEDADFREYETAYSAIQGSKPQTLGFGLTESVVPQILLCPLKSDGCLLTNGD